MDSTSWRKSSHSGSDGASNCVEVAWRKSSFSGSAGNGDCVEVALDHVEAAVRDSKNSAGPRLSVPYEAWRSFLTTIQP
ncbi:uncharacterized protein DUF397 [Labedaea rhizosphaerae]|uniref:Uncharacterized protein DUF397 n=2 Tax=Labedaea rhizosphaerae TaxID=598644 RepID=A0A4R6S8D7_LABRH|nr:DUF397 domain-containing protein [Labedaea rhizosphaerae]TDP96100.1 uncharacterized protein DUF397 [Labedaea rhizosphaerae]